MTLAAAAAPRPAGIEARGWGWRHAGRSAWALRGIDLRVDPGERILLLGPSGAGKSTLLLGLAGLLTATGGAESQGSLLLDGRPPADARDRVAIVFQDPDTQLVMGRAGDDIAFGLENRCVPTEAIWPRVDAALDAVGFPYGRHRPTTQLSGGEQQSLAIAGMLALRPGLILLDEPTANL
ncbi:MAG: ABC transporter ATP-binding protein, partial [Chloroflexi bacterium]